MDKCNRSRSKLPSYISEDSLLPPTLRHLNPSPYSVNHHQSRKKKRSINGFFKRVSSILDAQTSSSSLEDLPTDRHRRKAKGKSKSKSSSARVQPTDTDKRAGGQSMRDLLNANMELLESRLSNNNSQSRSSDGSLDGPRRLRKDKVKARVEARRDQQLRGDSSLEESGAEPDQVHPKLSLDANKKRSRASRTERYLKRMCNGKSPALDTSDHFQPIERVLPTGYVHDLSAVPYEHDITNDNFYARHTQVGVNPLVRQTLQYFSEFDRGMAPQPLMPKPRNQYPPPPERPPKNSPVPPKPPSRDHTSRILVNGASLDKYQQMMRHIARSPDKENDYHPSSRSSLYSPNTEVRNINEGRYLADVQPNPALYKYRQPPSPPRSPLRDSLNTTTNGVRAKYVEQPRPCFSTILQSNDFDHSSLAANQLGRPSSRRSSKNLEEALCELEAIYNSLQLGDEELLDRADRRTMEEFLYKGFTASPDALDGADPACRRKTWADPSLDNYKDEPDRLKDDMAYRRMHPKERPTSVDGQSSLSSISYLMTSPIPSRRDMPYVDPRAKPRRKEPDVTLDDVVFRSMQYANNTLKVVEPQPPFGIPLGPITTAADSDYLHTNPADSDRARSPYIPLKEPDIVTDDLAFRNLRKDAQPSSRQSSPSFLPSTPSPLPYGLKKKRAVRSLSANLYGLINKPTSPVEPDSEDLMSIHTNSTLDDYYHDVPKHSGRRISDPEVISPNWQRSTWQNLDVNRNNRAKQHHRDRYSDLDLSNRSCDDSSDERIRPTCERLRLADDNTDHKASSDRGSSCLSSVSGTPPPPAPRAVEPFTEHEISVYKKLCQDLENLVKLTKGIDDVPAPVASPNVAATEQNVSLAKLQESPASSSLPEETFSTKAGVEDVVISSTVTSEEKADVETSPIKRELSSILDSLKSLGEDSNRTSTSFSAEKEERVEKRPEVKKEAVTEEKSIKEITKDICDLVARDSVDNNEPRVKSVVEPKPSEAVVKKIKKPSEDDEDEEDEKKDKLDEDVFMRNVRLAKLSGDWKESTPNSAVVNRRTSLVNDDNNRHWEGMNKCNHKYNSMPAKTSSLLMFRQYGSKRKSKNRKSLCTIS